MTGDVVFERRGAAGLITLNRPKALNALTREMCIAMKAQLDDWAGDDGVKTVIIRSPNEKAFCAGGDIRALYEAGRAGGAGATAFYRDEYRLNATIKHFPKPYVALLHGIVMGGGVGISIHGSHRVMDQTVTFAMPETGIGLFPDVGGSYFLSRMPAEIGMYLALTGERLKTGDCAYAGIATHFVPQNLSEELLSALERGDHPDFVLNSFAESASAALLSDIREMVDRTFSEGSVEGILAALDAEATERTAAIAATLRRKSPTSLKVTFRQLREGRHLSFDDCLRMEYRMVTNMMAGRDFYEGVRALIIDKDNAPQWQPADLAQVSTTDVDAYFTPVPDELSLT
ncbi:MAG: enoyl-CoA hydratase/isomerase family protein [Alphaproteobacteria bacterium]|nr:enoyl-CoA hydratase/isomerase family protein [Alphaproteobacteria bacterium]